MKLPRSNFCIWPRALPRSRPCRASLGAQTYPSRPVRLIVGFPAGGAADIVARLIGQWLSERLGQPFVIENRPGAGSNIGTEAVVRAPAGRLYAALVASANAINATLYDKLNFNFMRDIAPVASIVRAPIVMVVNPSVPAKTVPEFIAYAKANPGKINMASAGIGTSRHVAGELFKMMTGVDMLHVPYRGAAPALTDLLGGQVQVMFATMTASIEHIRAGKLRALAVTTATRPEALPDVPTVGDFVPGYEASGWYGIGAPRNTPAEIVDRLNKEINAALADPKMQGAPGRSRQHRDGGARLPTSASSSPRKPRSGPRWSSSRASRRSSALSIAFPHLVVPGRKPGLRRENAPTAASTATTFRSCRRPLQPAGGRHGMESTIVKWVGRIDHRMAGWPLVGGRRLPPRSGTALMSGLIAAGVIAAYVLLEWLSFIHEYKGVPITPWNPGLGLVFAFMLLRGARYAAVLFAGAVIAEIAVLRSNLAWSVIISIAAIIAAGYGLVARVARDNLRLDAGLNRLRDVVLLLASGVAGAVLVAVFICLLLLADEDLDLERRPRRGGSTADWRHHRDCGDHAACPSAGLASALAIRSPVAAGLARAPCLCCGRGRGALGHRRRRWAGWFQAVLSAVPTGRGRRRAPRARRRLHRPRRHTARPGRAAAPLRLSTPMHSRSSSCLCCCSVRPA